MPVHHFEGVPRDPLAVALKNVLTFGVYTKVWLYRVNREMDGHEGFHIDLRWLAVMVTLPIITPAIVKFQTARRMNQMISHQVTLPILRANTLGSLSLLPILGAGFFAWWVQSTLNKHWFHHRREERVHLAEDRIRQIESEPEPSDRLLQKKAALEADVARMRREIEEEIEAARIRWGDERFADRKRRADLHEQQGARLNRKELAKLRAEEKAHRKAEKAARKKARGRLFGLLPPKADQTPADVDGEAAGPDPDNDEDWRPKTPLPERTPEAIQAAAEAEGRDELTPEEEKELKQAEKLLAKREKEEGRLEKQRAKLRERLEKQREKAEAQAEKERVKKEAAEEKAQKKKEAAEEKERLKAEKAKAKGKPVKAKDKKSKQKGKGIRKGKADAEAPTDKEAIPVAVKPRTLRAPPVVHEAGEGPLRTLTVTCPRCRTEIQGIQKRGDAPAKITCPTCSLVGKV